jgi:hypothetical protein
MVKRIAAVALLASTALLESAGADQELPLWKVGINRLTCDEWVAVAHPDVREKILVYTNGCLDGTVKATTWDGLHL